MSLSLQEFLAESAHKAAGELIKAFEALPEEKRGWSPEPGSRSALDQVAECALLCANAAELMQTRKWDTSWFESYFPLKERTTQQGWGAILPMLKQNAGKAAEAIRAIPGEELQQNVDMPWGSQTVAEIAAYPYWNMSYHLGQINYIRSMLGCLE